MTVSWPRALTSATPTNEYKCTFALLLHAQRRPLEVGINVMVNCRGGEQQHGLHSVTVEQGTTGLTHNEQKTKLSHKV